MEKLSIIIPVFNKQKGLKKRFEKRMVCWRSLSLGAALKAGINSASAENDLINTIEEFAPDIVGVTCTLNNCYVIVQILAAISTLSKKKNLRKNAFCSLGA